MLKEAKIKKIIKQQVFIIMVGTLLSKFLGLIRDSILAKYYGASLITDSYIIATLIPSLLIGTLATAILSTYIPILKMQKTKEEEQKFTNNFVNICVALITLLIGIYFVFNKQIVSIFVIGFAGEKLDITVKMTNITIITSYALVLISIYAGYLQSKGKYIATSFYGIIFNTISILGICMSYEKSYLIMPIMFAVGYFVSLFVLIVDSCRNEYKYSLEFNVKDQYIRKMIWITLPVMFNSIVWDINVAIDKSLTSTVGEGYVSALNYSYKVISVAIGVVATSIAVYIFPKLSEMFTKKEREKFNATVTNAIVLLLMLIIPITAFMIIFAEPIIRILFMRGNFDNMALEVTKTALQIYSISIIPISINTIIYKVFNSMQKNKIPAFNAVISIVINVVLNLVLVKPLGYKGIIIATAISNIVAMIMIIIKMKKEDIRINYKDLTIYAFKIIIATIISSVVSICISKNININIFIKMIVIGMTYLMVYVVILWLSKVKVKEIKM